MLAPLKIPCNAPAHMREPDGYLGGGFPQRISYLRVLPSGPPTRSIIDLWRWLAHGSRAAL